MNTQIINSNTTVIARKAAYKWFSNLPSSSQTCLVGIGIISIAKLVDRFTVHLMENNYSLAIAKDFIVLAPQRSA